MRALTARLICSIWVTATLCGCAVLTPWHGTLGTEPQPSEAEDVLVRIAASWSATPLAEDLSAAFGSAHPGWAIEITPGDSPAPAELLGDGRVDIAIVALPADGMRPPELPEAYAGGDATLLAFDALGIVVHADARLTGLTSEQLQRLYAGYVLDWAMLEAGAGQPEWISVPPGSAGRALFEERVLGGEAPSSATLLLPNDRAVVAYVAQHPLALGFASVAAVGEGVKLVALDGVVPTSRNVARGAYPHTWALYALISPEAPVEANEWLSYARSTAGQKLIGQRYALSR